MVIADKIKKTPPSFILMLCQKQPSWRFKSAQKLVFFQKVSGMVYFEDAESNPEPEIYFKADWKTVKRFFRKGVPIIAKKVMGLK